MPTVLASSGSSGSTSWWFVGVLLLITLLAMAVVFTAHRRGWLPVPRELSGLPIEARRQVVRAVERGVAVEDPALAVVTVAYAQTRLSRSHLIAGRGWQWFCWSMVALFAVSAVADLRHHDAAGTVLVTAIAANWIANPLLARRQHRHASRALEVNARRADESNRAMDGRVASAP